MAMRRGGRTRTGSGATRARGSRPASPHLPVSVHRREVALADLARERARLLERSIAPADVTRVATRRSGGAASVGVRGAAAGGAAAAVPRPTTSHDPRNQAGQRLTGAVRTQPAGDRRCVAHATAAAMEAFLRRDAAPDGDDVSFSIRHIFELSGRQELLGPTALGVAEGVFEGACFPRTSGCTDPASHRWRAAMHRLTVTSDPVAAMSAALRDGELLVVSIPMFSDFAAFSGGSVYRPRGQEIGAHALCIIGYQVDGGNGAWLVQNSFGEGWGDDGYARIAWEDDRLEPERVVYAVARVERRVS